METALNSVVRHLSATHLPSDVEELYASYAPLRSVSDLPTLVSHKTDLHDQLVSRGTMSGVAEDAMRGVLSRHAVSQGWLQTPAIVLDTTDAATIDRLADKLEKNAASKSTVVIPMVLYNGSDAHMTVGVRMGALNPEDPGEFQVFDPTFSLDNVDQWGMVWNELAKRYASTSIGMSAPQASLGILQACDRYGVCASMSVHALHKAIERYGKTGIFDMEMEGRKMAQSAMKDPRRAQKLDYWMISSAAAAAGKSVREYVRAPAYTGRAEEVADVADLASRMGRLHIYDTYARQPPIPKGRQAPKKR